MTAAGLSVIVWARRNTEHLSACLETVAFADSVTVVVSSDRADLIRCAEAAGVRIEKREAEEDAAETGNWILSIGDDMRVSPALAAAIGNAVAADEPKVWDIPVRVAYRGRLLRFGWTAGLSASRGATLERGGSPEQVGRTLPEAIDLVVGESVSDFLRWLDTESGFEAEALRREGSGRSLAETRKAVWRGFAASYLRAGGWREGRTGLLVAIGAALMPILSHLKAAGEPEASSGASA